MANYYLDFVGLNTFIYEPINFSINQEDWPYPWTSGLSFLEIGSNANAKMVAQDLNTFGWHDKDQAFVHDGDGIYGYKNYKFSHELPNTASFFPALMLHRNGPYGHPTWKQIRVGQNPLTRKQRKNSIFTRVEDVGRTIVVKGVNVFQRNGQIKAYVETPVISRFKPIVVRAADAGTQLEVKISMGNSICNFNNNELNKIYGLDAKKSPEYEQVTKLYLNGALNDDSLPLDEFSKLVYAETVYPNQIYSNKSYTRQRTNFVFNWRDSFDNRKQTSVDNGFGSTIDNDSMWPLDFDTTMGESAANNRYTNCYGKDEDDYANGILQNNYCQVADMSAAGPKSSVNTNSKLRPAPLYARKHLLNESASVVSPNGMKIEGVTDGTGAPLIDGINTPGGEAKWEAGAQSGKNPFYDSYDDYIQDVRQRGKGYTIAPEFRISSHIEELLTSGVDKKFTNMFEMTGGLSIANGSDDSNFYKIYSTSDFLKHFEVVRNDHKEFSDPAKITLKCKALKKFLPYNGFYPCQRTVDIANQFYLSYSSSVSIESDAQYTFLPIQDSAQIALQNFIAPLFAPGILFNTIKSGVACDYPIKAGHMHTGSQGAREEGDNYFVNAHETDLLFDRRLPFKSLVNPESYLAQSRLYNSDPHISSSANQLFTTFWDGTGDQKYKMMMHNFLAEVPSFFLDGGEFTTISSRASDDARVGNAKKDNSYTMRVKMYKTTNDAIAPLSSGSAGETFFVPPQYPRHTKENFTMYSRPSAFGPPSAITGSGEFEDTITGSDSRVGENYPFTPPYYHGQSWADITFKPTSTKKYTIAEIMEESFVRYHRYLDQDTTPMTGAIAGKADKKNELYNLNAMQLTASVNLFGRGEVKSIDLLDSKASNGVNVAVDISDDSKSRWIIQTKFETPMLNFNHLSASNSVHMPTNTSASVPRGMWHQHGRIETDTNKGIYLQVTDVPEDYKRTISGSTGDLSLKDLCGFSDQPQRLGQVSTTKTISEAVVAIPFIEEENRRKYFTLSPDGVGIANDNNLDKQSKRNLVGDSIVEMVEKMKKYVFPPVFDFINRSDIDPIAMYIFEFKHKLTQQDVADIWQNLPPDIGRSFEETEASVKHDLLADELLGEGSVAKSGRKRNQIPENIQWMVFKVKQRANYNYYNKIVNEQDKSPTTDTAFAKSLLKPPGYSSELSYNWPYDFFSMVELIKLDAEITIADTEIMKKEDINIVAKTAEPIRTTPSLPGASGPAQNAKTPQELLQEQIAALNEARGDGGFQSRSTGQSTQEEPKHTWVWTAVLPDTINIAIQYTNDMGAVSTTPPGRRYNGRVKKNNKSEVRKYLSDAGFQQIDNIVKV